MITIGGVFLFKELIKSARTGNGTAFAELSDIYKPLIETMTEKYAKSIGGGGADRDDIRQEASVAFYKAVRSFDLDQNEVSFGLYAKICIRNRLVSLLRSSKSKGRAVHEQESEKSPKQRQTLIDREELEILSRRLLSRREREIFLMYADGKRYSEIAEALGIAEKSVDNALFRAKKKLRSHYSEN